MEEIIAMAAQYYMNALKSVKDSNISRAVSNINQCIKIYGKDTDALNLLGLCHYQLCNFDEAKCYWDKSLRVNNENNRAESYLEIMGSEEFVKLISDYKQGLELLSSKQPGSALKLWQGIIEDNPELIEPYLICGLYHYQIKRYSKAERYWTKALTLDQGNKRAKRYIEAIPFHLAIR